ncbi:hypothetical protein YC2023_101608 [Brassica napus]
MAIGIISRVFYKTSKKTENIISLSDRPRHQNRLGVFLTRVGSVGRLCNPRSPFFTSASCGVCTLPCSRVTVKHDFGHHRQIGYLPLRHSSSSVPPTCKRNHRNQNVPGS